VNVNRWALSNEQSAPNPSAGLSPGKAQTPRSDAAVAKMSAGGSASPKDWQPTVLNLVILIVLETVAFGLLRYVFRSAHGG
jgi:hypothetical protein